MKKRLFSLILSLAMVFTMLAPAASAAPKGDGPLTHHGLQGEYLLGLDSDTFYIYHVAAVMVDNLRRLLLGINLSDKAIMDFDFPGVGFPV